MLIYIYINDMQTVKIISNKVNIYQLISKSVRRIPFVLYN